MGLNEDYILWPQDENTEKVFGKGSQSRYALYLRDVKGVRMMLAVDKVIEENPKFVEDMKNGKNKSFDFIVGQIKIIIPDIDSKDIMHYLKSTYR